MTKKKILWTLLIFYYIFFGSVVYLIDKEKIDLMMQRWQTATQFIIFWIIIFLSQLIFSSNLIKSKWFTIVFFDLILFILINCIYLIIGEWIYIIEINFWGNILLIANILFSIIIGLVYYKKYRGLTIEEFKSIASIVLLSVSTGFGLSFAIIHILFNKFHLLGYYKTQQMFKGLTIEISFYIGILVFFWTLGAFIMIKYTSRLK